MAMIAAAWASWRFAVLEGRAKWRGLVPLAVLIAAAFLSGSRNAYLSVPLVLALAAALEL